MVGSQPKSLASPQKEEFDVIGVDVAALATAPLKRWCTWLFPFSFLPLPSAASSKIGIGLTEQAS